MERSLKIKFTKITEPFAWCYQNQEESTKIRNKSSTFLFDGTPVETQMLDRY